MKTQSCAVARPCSNGLSRFGPARPRKQWRESSGGEHGWTFVRHAGLYADPGKPGKPSTRIVGCRPTVSLPPFEETIMPGEKFEREDIWQYQWRGEFNNVESGTQM